MPCFVFVFAQKCNDDLLQDSKSLLELDVLVLVKMLAIIIRYGRSRFRQ